MDATPGIQSFVRSFTIAACLVPAIQSNKYCVLLKIYAKHILAIDWALSFRGPSPFAASHLHCVEQVKWLVQYCTGLPLMCWWFGWDCIQIIDCNWHFTDWIMLVYPLHTGPVDHLNKGESEKQQTMRTILARVHARLAIYDDDDDDYWNLYIHQYGPLWNRWWRWWWFKWSIYSTSTSIGPLDWCLILRLFLLLN